MNFLQLWRFGHNWSVPMPRYYFHLKDIQIILDGKGTELADMEAVRKEAVMIFRDVLRGDFDFWSGSSPWRIWVTDRPNGKGDTLLVLQLSAS
jgi:hypothetical protein